MFDRAQLLKGTLEGCILQIIERQTTYGYEIAVLLCGYGFADLTEGTLYPLLLRLERKGLISAEFRPSPSGPSRKYYILTQAGAETLAQFHAAWRQVSTAVGAVLEGEDAQ